MRIRKVSSYCDARWYQIEFWKTLRLLLIWDVK